ncbi:MAG TPA: hypothetical protein VFE37_21145 [Chloroflexota bacterium]|nr:hypothetical protein [Chloroflexota bacterium]
MATAIQQLHAKSLDVPDETHARADKARVEVVHLGGTTAVRSVFQPGFRWSEHIKPSVGTELCEVRHVGYVVAGRICVRLADGTERELVAGDAFDVPAGHDAWVLGDEPYISIDFSPAQETASRSADGAAYVPPKDHKVLLENERVRVLDVRIKPGATTGMHSHPPCVAYALSSTRVRFSTPDGSSREVKMRAGEATWSDGGWHNVENVGAADDWGIIVELKG